MSVLDRAKAHWAPLKRGSVDVPEWETVVHFDRLTIADQQRLQKDLKADPVGTGVRLIIAKARNGDGSQMFDNEPSTLNALLNDVSPQVVERILSAMTALPSEGAAAKN